MFALDLFVELFTLVDIVAAVVHWALTEIEAVFLTLPERLVENVLSRWQIASAPGDADCRYPLAPLVIAMVFPGNG